MNTGEIVALLSERLHRDRDDVRALLDRVADTLTDEIVAHDTFRLPGLGTFGTIARAAHRWFDPSARRFRRLPEHFAVFFHASRTLKRRLSPKRG